MTGPHPAGAATRVAVRQSLPGAGTAGDRRTGGATDATDADADADRGPPLVLVACSGGADSLALAAATAFEASKLGLRAGAVVVDHQLQAGSPSVAAAAAEQCRGLGLDPVEVRTVEVGDPASSGGPEAAARNARHTALGEATDRLGASAVLLGHTRDDQAEQVLLGLVRGSGARSLSGMPRARDHLLRPLLGLDRSVTRAACEAQGLSVWQDPHNDDDAYRRVRARRLLRTMEDELGPGVGAALARTAELLREDADCLDELALGRYRDLGDPPWDSTDLAGLPRAIRMRVWQLVAADHGASGGALSATHLRAVDALVSDWRGQGAVDLPGGVQALRSGGQVSLRGRRQVE